MVREAPINTPTMHIQLLTPTVYLLRVCMYEVDSFYVYLLKIVVFLELSIYYVPAYVYVLIFEGYQTGQRPL